MRRLAIGVAAACLTCVAVMPANAQGLWIGVPGFGVGIGAAPAYAYTPYYDGYWGTPYVGTDYAYAPAVAYSAYAYEPDVEYDAYAPTYSYGTYGPRVYAYERSGGYRSAPRYSRGYAYSPQVRTARTDTYSDTRRVIRRDRYRASELPNRGVQQRAVMRDRPEIRAEKRNISSRQTKPDASDHFARGSAQDLRPSKRLDSGRARTRTDGY
jgi:hypothetical protein